MVAKQCVEEFSGNHFEEKIKSGVVIIDFFAEWCMPCLMMSPIVEEMCEKFKKVKFMKVNIDENQALAGKFDVMSIPTLIVFKNGKVAGRITGALPSNVLEEKIKELL